MSNTTLTIDQLCLSPLNVRTYSPDAEDTVGLQASILAEGLINPISVHPLKGNKTKWGAVAGGRRYRAIKALIGNGDLPTDYAVKVQILDTLSDAELIEHSITENLIRRDLRDYEICAGVARAASRGHSVDQIAKGIGQANVTNVGRWLRLGRLAPTIFDAFRTGAISHEQASAFAATEDQDLQRVTFERLAPISTHLPTPAEIRRAMNVGDAKAKRDLAFVGADAYRAAGGRFELDLFADAAEERGRVVDDGKLQQLVDARIAIVRDEVRVTTNRPDLRFLTEQPKDQWGSVDHQLIVKAKQLGSGRLELPSEDVVAHIAIDASGAPIVSYWWESRKAKFGSERKAAAADIATLTTPAPPVQPSPFDGHHRIETAAKTDDGASQDSLFALSAVRKVIERAALHDDARAGGSVGLDYLVWVQARSLLVRSGYSRPQLGMWVMGEGYQTGVSHEAHALARDMVSGTNASRICAHDVLTITDQDFFTDPDIETAFQAYRDASAGIKRLTAAVVAGFALERSLAGADRRCEMHDIVGRAVGLGNDAEVRDYWTPTGDMLDMFPKAQRLAIAEPFVDRATILTWAKLKSSELTTGVLSAVTRAGSKGASWVHPLLRFGDLPASADAGEAS